ncbi:MAG: peptide chain release factor N(5)-glutamine methyltransferase [Planctomycetia bacterium]|nr:peptide chain release factor N(5)-glutamine methyltransferase [Planctomycetia bacterium]
MGELLDWTAKHLAEQGVEFPRLDAEVLLAHAVGCKRIELYTRHGEIAAPEYRQRYRELIGQRLEGCPVAYLVGRKEFFSLELEVSPAVLIPRPDSEHVVMECLRLAEKQPAPTVLDLGVGSGNLSIAIAHRHQGARVTAVDVSPEALAVARRNAEKHGVASRLEFLAGDLCAPVAGRQFDFIVSNPPYIPHGDIAGLALGVRDYEPHRALDGGPDGFAVFDRLVREAITHLNPGGWLLVEIGAPQEQAARRKLSEHGGYELANTIFDYSGHPRVLAARRR